jgi:hypothetical protein
MASFASCQNSCHVLCKTSTSSRAFKISHSSCSNFTPGTLLVYIFVHTLVPSQEHADGESVSPSSPDLQSLPSRRVRHFSNKGKKYEEKAKSPPPPSPPPSLRERQRVVSLSLSHTLSRFFSFRPSFFQIIKQCRKRSSLQLGLNSWNSGDWRVSNPLTWERTQQYNIAAFWNIAPGPLVSPHFW